MTEKNRSGVLAVLATALCIVAFSTILVVVVRSFRSAIADIAESETRVTVVNADGSVFYDTGAAVESHASREEVRRAFAEGRCTTLRHSETLDRDLLYCARREGDRVVRLAIPYTGVLRSERLAWGTLAAAVIVGACVVLFVFLVVRRIGRRLDEQARRLEVAAESEAFRRAFTSNVAHELKSPITAILGSVETLDDSMRLSEDDRRELLGIVRTESTRLEALLRDVLSLARIEHEETCPTRDFTALQLNELVSSVMSRYESMAAASNVRLVLKRNDPAVVKGDVVRLEEVLQNLLDNALRHSGTDRIEVSSALTAKGVEVSVTDHGVGIASEHLPHLFERFYRVDKSRSRAQGGTGLGLAIVKHLVQLHGGTVQARSQPGAGTTFTFCLKQSVGAGGGGHRLGRCARGHP